jgi:WD40 repeat protein
MDGTTRVRDATGGTALAVFRSTGSTVASAWQPGGRGVLSADLHGVMQEWDVTRALRGTASRQHAGAVRDLALSRDGKWSVTAGDGGVVLWDVTADVARTTLHVAGAINAQFSADGTRLVVVDADGGALWSVPDGTLVHRLAPAIRRAGFSPDGQTIVTGAADGTLQLWNASGGELAHLPIGFVPDDIVFDPAGRWAVPYAVYGDPHETDAPVIDLHTKAIVAHLRGTHTAPYTVAATATRLATNDGADVVLWDTATWQPVARMSGHTSDCTALAFLPDGRVVSAGDDHATYVWSSDGKLLATLPTGGARVWTIAPSHDGALFATGGRDGVVRVWDAASYGELMAMASHLGGSTYTAFTADDGWLLSAGTDGRVVRWDVRRPARSAAELASLVRCRVPYRFEGDDVLPREPDFDDPSCRN